MPKFDQKVIDQFCNACDWLIQCWHMRKYLYDENEDSANLAKPEFGHFFQRLSLILHEYWIQQLMNLHDPSSQNGHDNLSIAYIIEREDWDETALADLVGLKDKMAR